MDDVALSPSFFGGDDNPLGGDGDWLVTVGGKRIIPGKALKQIHRITGWTPLPGEFARLAPRRVPVARTRDRAAADAFARILDDAGAGGDVAAAGDDVYDVILTGPFTQQRDIDKALRRLRWVPGLEEGVDPLEGVEFPVHHLRFADAYPLLVADTMVAVLRTYRVDALLDPDPDADADADADWVDDTGDDWDDTGDDWDDTGDDWDEATDGDDAALGAAPPPGALARHGLGREPLLDVLEEVLELRRTGTVDDDETRAMLRELAG